MECLNPPEEKLQDNAPSIQIETPTFETFKKPRPHRRAALRARQAIKSSVHNISCQRKKPKHGWIYEDQVYDDLIFTNVQPHENPDDDPSQGQDPPSNTDETTSTSEATSDNEEEEELIWDNSPHQYSLLPNLVFNNSAVINPSTSTPLRQPQEGAQRSLTQCGRNRTFATSDDQLQRSNAFKLSTFNTGFMNTPTHNPPQPTQHLTTAPEKSRRTRIPKPTTTTDVNLHQVADVSQLLSNEDVEVHEDPRRRSQRKTSQPTSYRVFHRSGWRGRRNKE